jgi:hypothetical protein
MKNYSDFDDVGGKTKIVRQKPKRQGQESHGRNNDYRRDQRKKIVEGKRSYGEE